MHWPMPRWYPLPQAEDCLGTSASAPMLVMPGNVAFCAEKFSGSRE